GNHIMPEMVACTPFLDPSRQKKSRVGAVLQETQTILLFGKDNQTRRHACRPSGWGRRKRNRLPARCVYDDEIRIISMRKADSHETDLYYQNVGYY
ncbi:MAG: BrnT family toxin, partial [Desulfobulbus sp.]|nr:BrnT family toxin [Desulfobulbus sp.]